MATGCCLRASRRPLCLGTGATLSMPAGVLCVPGGPVREQAQVCASFQTRSLPPDSMLLHSFFRNVSKITVSQALDTRSSSGSVCHGRILRPLVRSALVAHTQAADARSGGMGKRSETPAGSLRCGRSLLCTLPERFAASPERFAVFLDSSNTAVRGGCHQGTRPQGRATGALGLPG